MWISVWEEKVTKIDIWEVESKQRYDNNIVAYWKWSKKTFSKTWAEQSWTVPVTWKYKLEVRWAEWGNLNWNQAAWWRWWYACWTVKLTAGTVLKIYVWWKWWYWNWADSWWFNWWGKWWSYSYRITSNTWWGWWASDIRIWWNTLYDRLIVAWWGWGWNAWWAETEYAYGWWESWWMSRAWNQWWTQTSAWNWASFWNWASNWWYAWNNYWWAWWGWGWYWWWSGWWTSDGWNNNYTAWWWSWFVWTWQEEVPDWYLVSEDYILSDTQNIAWNQEMPNPAWWTMTWNTWDWLVVISCPIFLPQYQKVTEPWVYHNEELWLISMSADGEHWVTIDDKNVGAWSNDIEDELSYGWYFQFWNSHGFWVLPWPVPPTPWPRLPEAYQEVEYIESSGTQWIDTWIIPNSNTKIQTKLSCTNNSWYCSVWYYAWSDTQDRRLFLSAETKWAVDIPWWSWSWNRINWWVWTYWTVEEIEFGNFYIKNLVSWQTYTWMAWTFTWTSTIKLNRDEWLNLNDSNVFYYVKIRDWNTLVRDLVPCYRKADGLIWMYDLVNDQFYTNAWTWTFTKWPNVYYDRNWQPWENTVLYMPLNWDLQDYSWSNNHWTWNWTSEYKAVDGKKYAYFNENSCIDLTSYPIWTWNPAAFTNSCVVKLNSSWQATMHYFGQDANNSRSKLITFYSDWRILQDRYWSSYDIYIWNTIPSSLYWTRVHIVYVYDWNWWHTVYLNGELYWTWNWTLNVVWWYNKRVWSPNSSDSAWYWLAEFIIENWMWTAEDVTDYFTRVKTLYNIS